MTTHDAAPPAAAARDTSTAVGSGHPGQPPAKEWLEKSESAVQFTQQAEKLSLQKREGSGVDDIAVEARFVTPLDPVIVTAEGHRLPGVPLQEAHKLNILKEELQGDQPAKIRLKDGRETKQTLYYGDASSGKEAKVIDLPDKHKHPSVRRSTDGSLRRSMPPSHTNPLFPPLPLYGPPSLLRDLQCLTFRVTSFFLSLAFLGVIVLGALFTSVGPFLHRLWMRVTLRNPDARRPFYDEEMRRKEMRREMEKSWKRRRSHDNYHEASEEHDSDDGYTPTEGGRDPVKCDVAYYARRVGLDVEEFEVQTEDGFLIELWHVYDPREYTEATEDDRSDRGPDVFSGERKTKSRRLKNPDAPRKFPVLLIHGLLQSSGAYCTNDDDSLAFYLCKSGFDVWLGNNRCGFKPKHVLLEYSDPRMWSFNIRQMGVFDLPALTSRVLYETGFEKIALIGHSQGTTETLVALAKEQRPELGEKLTVFCALAPAAYAGPLIGKMYFKFMRIISPAGFRIFFGIHAFIPFMMSMHRLLPPHVYGWMGYKVFSFLFNWTDERWDRGLRDRMFQFAPVYVSSESMRWWLGRECFAKHKCILSTKEEWRAEDREDGEQEKKELEEAEAAQKKNGKKNKEAAATTTQGGGNPANVDPQALEKADEDMEGRGAVDRSERAADAHRRSRPKGSTAWYDERAPPFALWVAGNDALVDGEKLIRRLRRGREPCVELVHSKVIPGYEHLDVIWAMDAPDQVFCEVREVLWKTAPADARARCRVPKGCEHVEQWVPKQPKQKKQRRQAGSPNGNTEDHEQDDQGQQSSSSSSSGSNSSSEDLPS